MSDEERDLLEQYETDLRTKRGRSLRHRYVIEPCPGGFVAIDGKRKKFYRRAYNIAALFGYYAFGRTLQDLEAVIFKSRDNGEYTFMEIHPPKKERREIHGLLKGNERTSEERRWVVLFETQERYIRYVTFLLNKKRGNP